MTEESLRTFCSILARLYLGEIPAEAPERDALVLDAFDRAARDGGRAAGVPFRHARQVLSDACRVAYEHKLRVAGFPEAEIAAEIDRAVLQAHTHGTAGLRN